MRRISSAALALALSLTPAFATTYQLTTAWQKVGSAGQTLDLQNRGPNLVLLSTTNGPPTDNNDGQAILGLGQADGHRLVTLTTDLYARAPNNTSLLGVLDGLGVGSGSSAVTPSAGSQEQDVRSSGTLDATKTSGSGSYIDIPVNGQSSIGLRFSGLAASGATVSYLQSVDGGQTYTPMAENNTGTGGLALTRATDGQVGVNAARRTNVRIQVTTAGTGTVSVAWTVSVRPFAMAIDAPLPPGGNTIGAVNVLGGNTAAVKTDGSATTQPVSGTVTASQGPAGAQPWLVQWSGQSVAVSNTVPVSQSGAWVMTQGPAGSAAWKVDGSGVTQPVNGTITANLGTLNGAATAAGQSAQQGPVAPGAASAASVLGAAVYNSTAPAPTNGQQLALQSDAAGNLKINTTNGALETGGNLAATASGLGNQADAAAASDTSTASLIALEKRLLQATTTLNAALAAVNTKTPALGQATKAGSQPVAIASDQGSLTVADPNNAAYSSVSATFATGATVTAGRAVYLNCSASGSVTMSLNGGGSLAYPVTAGGNVLPFAVTSVSADTASCTHQTIN